MTDTKLGQWTIRYDPPLIPVRDLDHVGVHDDFDGAPLHSESDDCADRRCFRGPSEMDVIAQIKEYNLDNGLGCAECGDDWSELVMEKGGHYDVCLSCREQQEIDAIIPRDAA